MKKIMYNLILLAVALIVTNDANNACKCSPMVVAVEIRWIG